MMECKPVPARRLGNLVVVDDNPAVGEAGMAAVRRCRASVQAFHQTLKGTRGDLENLAIFPSIGDFGVVIDASVARVPTQEFLTLPRVAWFAKIGTTRAPT